MFAATLALAAALVASGPWKMGTGEAVHVPGERVSTIGYDDTPAPLKHADIVAGRRIVLDMKTR